MKPDGSGFAICPERGSCLALRFFFYAVTFLEMAPLALENNQCLAMASVPDLTVDLDDSRRVQAEYHCTRLELCIQTGPGEHN